MTERERSNESVRGSGGATGTSAASTPRPARTTSKGTLTEALTPGPTRMTPLAAGKDDVAGHYIGAIRPDVYGQPGRTP